MSPLLSCQDLSKSFGSRTLFQTLSFGVFRRDRIGLIGPNGAGKSTLLKILAGLEQPSGGSVIKSRSLRTGYIPQETEFPNQSIYDVVYHSFGETDHISNEEKDIQTAIVLSQTGFTDTTIMANTLSGGWKKRLAIAAALVQTPDIIFLDEPTNHLDLEGVIWLEEFLKNAPFAFIVITHDRDFLEHVADRMMEVNPVYPKNLFAVDGSYSTFLEKREEFLEGQLQQERSLNSKVRREVEWLHQNPKARTTKSRSRIQEAHQLSRELADLKGRNKVEKTQFDFETTQRDTKKLLVATNLAKGMGSRQLFSGISFTLSPGVRLGILGKNGSGKTTLLRLLKGEISPDKGTLKYADGVRVVYFDQHRAQLSPTISLREALAPDGESVIYRGKPIHVNSWCKRFLFSPDRLDLPFGQLSGGEKARVHLARLMLEPADILLLDEPTNDLDIPTLEILEESLLNFPGAVVMISHDRYMLDQVSTLFLGLGEGLESHLFADFKQWENALHQESIKKIGAKKPIKETSPNPEQRPKKLSWAEKNEWEQMENNIVTLELEINQLQMQIQSQSMDAVQLNELCSHLGTKQSALEELFKRWEYLEEKIKQTGKE